MCIYVFMRGISSTSRTALFVWQLRQRAEPFPLMAKPSQKMSLTELNKLHYITASFSFHSSCSALLSGWMLVLVSCLPYGKKLHYSKVIKRAQRITACDLEACHIITIWCCLLCNASCGLWMKHYIYVPWCICRKVVVVVGRKYRTGTSDSRLPSVVRLRQQKHSGYGYWKDCDFDEWILIND